MMSPLFVGLDTHMVYTGINMYLIWHTHPYMVCILMYYIHKPAYVKVVCIVHNAEM